jgi:hypothetical protein
MHSQMVDIHTLKLRLSFLAHDLRTFQSNPHADSEARLSASIAPHNRIGPPYLTEQEAVEALAKPLHEFRSIDNPKGKFLEDVSEKLGTFLDKRLGEILHRRHENKGDKPDFVLCASHDLAPLLQAALCLERGFDDTKEFKRLYRHWSKGC